MSGLDINSLRKQADGAYYVSPVRICITADGELVDELDPRAVTLLVGAGCSIPRAEAEKYGLIGEPPALKVEEPVEEPKPKAKPKD